MTSSVHAGEDLLFSVLVQLIIMIGAAISHARQGESKQTVATSVVTLLVAFIAIGRLWINPI